MEIQMVADKLSRKRKETGAKNCYGSVGFSIEPRSPWKNTKWEEEMADPFNKVLRLPDNT